MKIEQIRKQHDLVRSRAKIVDHHAACLGASWGTLSSIDNMIREIERLASDSQALRAMVVEYNTPPAQPQSV